VWSVVVSGSHGAVGWLECAEVIGHLGLYHTLSAYICLHVEHNSKVDLKG
jgi:hypothetical protein